MNYDYRQLIPEKGIRYQPTMFFAIYNGVRYNIENDKYSVHLISNNALDETSIKKKELFYTEKAYADLDEYGKMTLYCKYQGKVFPINACTSDLRNIRLSTKDDESKLGFELDFRDGFFFKDIELKDSEGIFYQEAFYLDYLKNNRPDLFAKKIK